MTKAESVIFRGVFKEIGFFEQLNVDTDEICESYENMSLAEAVKRLTGKIIKGLEDMYPDESSEHLMN